LIGAVFSFVIRENYIVRFGVVVATERIEDTRTIHLLFVALDIKVGELNANTFARQTVELVMAVSAARIQTRMIGRVHSAV
jgi:uncharacterized protein related to proFAR isomerase